VSARPQALLTIVALVLIAIVPLLLEANLGADVGPGSTGAAVGLVLVVIALSGARLSWLIAAGERRLVELSLWLFVYVFLGLAPLVQIQLGRYPGTTPGVLPRFNLEAAGIVLGGSVALVIGLLMVRRRDRAGAQESHVPVVTVRRARGLACAAVLLLAYYVLRVGPAALLASRAALDDAAGGAWPDPTVRAVVGALTSMLPLVAAVALLQVERDELSRADARINSGLALVTMALLLIAVNPISSARYVFGTVLLGLLAGAGVLYSSKRRYQIVASGAIAALVLVFPVADAFRYSGRADLSFTGPVESLVTPDYDAFAQINNAAAYVHRYGPSNGRQALGVVLFWVPRSQWSGKPVDTGVLLAQQRGYKVTNLSAPLWAELYVNGGWGVLLAGMFALGAAARRADLLIRQTLQHRKAPGVLACILPFYLVLVLRGSLLQAMAYLVVICCSSVFVQRSGSGLGRLVRFAPVRRVRDSEEEQEARHQSAHLLS